MNLKLSDIVLRPWTLEDVMFSLRVRNHPLLMKYFRQDDPISVEEQKKFISEDLFKHHYNGLIIEVKRQPVGLCSVKDTGEFTLGLLPEYQHKGIATEVMKMLIARECEIWSEVFVGNPALEWFISKLGFKVSGVRERAYFKQGIGLIDVVSIYHE